MEENKGQYYNALRRTQKTLTDEPDWEPWIGFFLRALKKQASILAARVESSEVAVSASEELHPLSQEVLALFETADRLSLAKIVEQTGANRNTLKVRLRELVGIRKLQLFGKGRGAFYTK